jgi:hypothetical protein
VPVPLEHGIPDREVAGKRLSGGLTITARDVRPQLSMKSVRVPYQYDDFAAARPKLVAAFTETGRELHLKGTVADVAARQGTSALRGAQVGRVAFAAAGVALLGYACYNMVQSFQAPAKPPRGQEPI